MRGWQEATNYQREQITKDLYEACKVALSIFDGRYYISQPLNDVVAVISKIHSAVAKAEGGGGAMNTQEKYLGSLAWAVDKIMEASEHEMARSKAEGVKCPCLKKLYLSGRKIGEGLFKNVYECEVCGRVDVRIEGDMNHEMPQ